MARVQEAGRAQAADRGKVLEEVAGEEHPAHQTARVRRASHPAAVEVTTRRPSRRITRARGLGRLGDIDHRGCRSALAPSAPTGLRRAAERGAARLTATALRARLMDAAGDAEQRVEQDVEPLCADTHARGEMILDHHRLRS